MPNSVSSVRKINFILHNCIIFTIYISNRFQILFHTKIDHCKWSTLADRKFVIAFTSSLHCSASKPMNMYKSLNFRSDCVNDVEHHSRSLKIGWCFNDGYALQLSVHFTVRDLWLATKQQLRKREFPRISLSEQQNLTEWSSTTVWPIRGPHAENNNYRLIRWYLQVQFTVVYRLYSLQEQNTRSFTRGQNKLKMINNQWWWFESMRFCGGCG